MWFQGSQSRDEGEGWEVAKKKKWPTLSNFAERASKMRTENYPLDLHPQALGPQLAHSRCSINGS